MEQKDSIFNSVLTESQAKKLLQLISTKKYGQKSIYIKNLLLLPSRNNKKSRQLEPLSQKMG